MTNEKTSLIVPILLIATGVGWLLTTLGIAPRIDWVWTIGLATVGFLSFLVGGFDKMTVVVGPFFLLASSLSLLRQTGRITSDVELPILVIAFGVLLLITRIPAVPTPKWMTPAKSREK